MKFKVYFSDLAGLEKTFGNWVIKTAIRVCTHSRIYHCAFGDEDVVMNVTLKGNHFWPRLAYEAIFPGIMARVTLEGEWLDSTVTDWFSSYVEKPNPWFPTFWRWLLRGRWKFNRDCVCSTIACCWAIGIDVDPHITSPRQLLEWFHEHGYPISFARNGRGLNPPDGKNVSTAPPS
jgi:hypothetical protein